MGNPANPVIWLKNHRPFTWLRRIDLVPYQYGRCARRASTVQVDATVGTG